MAFPKADTPTPTGIAAIQICMFSPDPALLDGQSSIQYNVQVRLSDGSSKTLVGDLSPHLTAQQATQLTAFMAAMRTKATAEILP